MISVFSLDRCAASAALLSACDDAFHMYATPQERATLDRLRLAEARSAYRISHGALRLAIRQTTGEFPVTLLRSASGKPFCPDGPEFSLSHSGDLTVIAVSPRNAVGLDVERIGATGRNRNPALHRGHPRGDEASSPFGKKLPPRRNHAMEYQGSGFETDR